jgi:hypothetical protein
VVGIEDLTEKGPQGDGGRIDALAEEHAEALGGAMDEPLGQVLGQGQAVGLAQLLTNGKGWAHGDKGVRLAQRRPPVQLAMGLLPC